MDIESYINDPNADPLDHEKFNLLVEYIKNNYEKYDITDLFYQCDDNYKINIDHFNLMKNKFPEITNNSEGLNLIFEKNTLLTFGRLLTEFKMCYMRVIEQLPYVNNHNYPDFIKFTQCNSSDPIHNINRNDSYKQFYNFMEKNSMGFAKPLIHEYANTPICKINIYDNNNKEIWSAFVYKFPFTDFPKILYPVCCSIITSKKIVVTDFNMNVNGNNITDINNKLSLEYDNIIINNKYHNLAKDYVVSVLS